MITSDKKITIIDQGISNVGSVKRAINSLGFDAIITKKNIDIDQSTHIILPGVGSFNNGMKRLKENEIEKTIKFNVLTKKKPILGICLGMHLLSSYGYENEKTEGLNLIEGEVLEMKPQNLRLPHMGWNQINHNDNPLFKGIISGKDFYFVHRFEFKPKNNVSIAAYTHYGTMFVSAINKDNIYGVQFHPEKSMKQGLAILKNFIELNA